MSASAEINDAKGAVDKLEKAASALDDYVTNVNKLAKAGEDLSEVQALFKNVKIFGKLSSFAGFASFGLDFFIGVFGLGGPDKEDLILNAISDLDNKVTGLWNAMDRQFETLRAELEEAVADLKIFRSLNFFAGLVKAGSSEDSATLLLDERYDPADILAEFGTIVALLKSDSLKENILAAEFNTSHGDIRTISSRGMQLHQCAVLAPIAYTKAFALRHKAGRVEKMTTPESVEKNFTKDIDAITEKVERYTKDCWMKAEENIKKRVEELFVEVPDIQKRGEGRRKASKTILDALAAQWSWLDFLVIVSSPIGAAARYGANDKDFGYHFWRDHEVAGDNFTAFVAWTNKKHDALDKLQFAIFCTLGRSGDGTIIINTNDRGKYTPEVEDKDHPEKSYPLWTPRSAAFFTGGKYEWYPNWTNSDRIGMDSVYWNSWLTDEQKKELRESDWQLRSSGEKIIFR